MRDRFSFDYAANAKVSDLFWEYSNLRLSRLCDVHSLHRTPHWRVLLCYRRRNAMTPDVDHHCYTAPLKWVQKITAWKERVIRRANSLLKDRGITKRQWVLEVDIPGPCPCHYCVEYYTLR